MKRRDGILKTGVLAIAASALIGIASLGTSAQAVHAAPPEPPAAVRLKFCFTGWSESTRRMEPHKTFLYMDGEEITIPSHSGNVTLRCDGRTGSWVVVAH